MKEIIIILLLAILTSCDDIFEKDIEEYKVEVVLPKNYSTVKEGEVSFLWKSLNGAMGYHLTIISPSFINASRLIADTVIWNDSLSEKLKYKQVLKPGDYQWNIRGINSSYTSLDNILHLLVIDNEDEVE